MRSLANDTNEVRARNAALARERYAADPAKAVARVRKWRDKNRARDFLQRGAYAYVMWAITEGLLTRLATCEQCGGDGGGWIEAAHSDYSQPLLVRWLCRGCHRVWDREEPKTMPGLTMKISDP